MVSSENSTVAELATTLQADISQLQAAASFACRLGWAVKLIDPASILQDSNAPGSPKSLLSDEEDGSHATMGSANLSGDGIAPQPGDVLWTENSSPATDCSRVAFVVDANITSYLMMGSVSPGLYPVLFHHFFATPEMIFYICLSCFSFKCFPCLVHICLLTSHDFLNNESFR